MSIATGTNYIYTVQPGDTLYSIATRFGSTVQAIAQANYLYPPVMEPNLIYPGQKLVIPTVSTNQSSIFYVVAPGDNLYTIAQRFSTSVDLLAGTNPIIYQPDLIFPGHLLHVPAFLYIVEPSDSLYELERRFGVRSADIIQANQDRPAFSTDIIWPGYALIIPIPT